MTSPESEPHAASTLRDSPLDVPVGSGGCSAAEPGALSPILGAAYTKPFRWEVVPEPNPECATRGPHGEADTRELADAALRAALSMYAAGFGFLYEVAGKSGAVRELARYPVHVPDPKPPAW